MALRIGPNEVVRMMRENGDRCHYCRRTFSETVHASFDHVFPVCNGGKQENNLVLCCKRCNEGKSNIPVEDFLNGYVIWNRRTGKTRENGHPEWIQGMHKVRGPRKWYHGNLIKW